MNQPIIPFEPSNEGNFINPFDGVTDKNEILAMIANISHTVTTHSVSAIKNTCIALKQNVQDLANTSKDSDVVEAATTALAVFAKNGL